MEHNSSLSSYSCPYPLSGGEPQGGAGGDVQPVPDEGYTCPYPLPQPQGGAGGDVQPVPDEGYTCPYSLAESTAEYEWERGPLGMGGGLVRRTPKRKKVKLEKQEKKTKGSANRNHASAKQWFKAWQRKKQLTLARKERPFAKWPESVQQQLVREFSWLSQSQVSKRLQDPVFEKQMLEMEEQASQNKKGGRGIRNPFNSNKCMRTGETRRSADWPKEEEQLVESIKKKRNAGVKVRCRWVRAEMRNAVKFHHPHNERAAAFKGSPGWLVRFFARHGMCLRVRNNKKPFDVTKYVPRLQSFYRQLRHVRATTPHSGDPTVALEVATMPAPEHHVADMDDEKHNEDTVTPHARPSTVLDRSQFDAEVVVDPGGGGAEETRGGAGSGACVTRWGGYGPCATYNVDQVPLPFACDDGKTVDFVGAHKVWVKSLGSGLDKRQCTLQLCCRAQGQQPQPTLIFRGGPQRTAAQEEEAEQYDDDVHVMWQKKAWMDDDLCVAWGEWFFDQPAECVNIAHNNILLADNLGSQTKVHFRQTMAMSRTRVVLGVPHATHIWQPIDAGIGKHYKRLIGNYYNEWMDSGDAQNYFAQGSIPTWKRRVLLTQWVGRAWRELEEERISVPLGQSR
jgi:hypothetical protein